MKNKFESLPMPKCGTKSTEGCYDCIGQDTCELLIALSNKNLYISKCPICDGTMLEQEITSSNPHAMSECIEDGCDYRCNQFMSYEDFKEIYGDEDECDAGDECNNCLNCMF